MDLQECFVHYEVHDNVFDNACTPIEDKLTHGYSVLQLRNSSTVLYSDKLLSNLTDHGLYTGHVSEP